MTCQKHELRFGGVAAGEFSGGLQPTGVFGQKHSSRSDDLRDRKPSIFTRRYATLNGPHDNPWAKAHG